MKSLVRNISHFWSIELVPTDAVVKEVGAPKITPEEKVIKKVYDPNYKGFREELGLDYNSSLAAVGITGGFKFAKFYKEATIETNGAGLGRLLQKNKLDTSIQRKVQSIDIRVEESQPNAPLGSARVTFSGLTMSQAESTQLLLKTGWRINLGQFDFFGVTKMVAPMFQGLISEKQVSFAEHGIDLTITLKEMVAVSMEAPFPFDIFYPEDGITTFEAAMDSFGKFIGCKVMIALSSLEISKWEAELELNKLARYREDNGISIPDEPGVDDKDLIGARVTEITGVENQGLLNDGDPMFKVKRTLRKYVWREFFFNNPEGVYKKGINGKPIQKTPKQFLNYICDYYGFKWNQQGNIIYIRDPKNPDDSGSKKFFYYRQMPDVGRIPYLENIQFNQITEDANGDLFEKFEVLETWGTAGASQGMALDNKKNKQSTYTEKLTTLQINSLKAWQMAVKGSGYDEAMKQALEQSGLILAQLEAQINKDQPAIYGDLIALNNGSMSTPELAAQAKALEVSDPAKYQAVYGRGNSAPAFGRVSGATGDIDFKVGDKFDFFGGKIYTSQYQAVAVEYIFDNTNGFRMNIVGRAIKKLNNDVDKFLKTNPVPKFVPTIYFAFNSSQLDRFIKNDFPERYDDFLNSRVTTAGRWSEITGVQGYFFWYENGKLLSRRATLEEEEHWRKNHKDKLVNLSKEQATITYWKQILSAWETPLLKQEDLR